MLVSATRRGRREARLSRHRCGGLMITRRHYFCASVYLFFKVKLFMNRIKRSLLQKEEKKKGKKISLLVCSLFLSRNATIALRFSVFLRQLCKHPLEETGKREMTKRKERKKERKERKKGRILNPKKLFV